MRRRRADDDLARMDALQRVDELACRERLGQVAVGALAQRSLDQLFVEVPRVDGHAAGVRTLDQRFDVLLVRLALGEVVVERDVDGFTYALGQVDLDDDDPILVAVEQVGDPEQDDFVVVDQADPDRRPAAPGGHRRL